MAFLHFLQDYKRKSRQNYPNVEQLILAPQFQHLNSEPEALKDLSKYKNSSIAKNGNNYTTPFWENNTSIIPTAEELKTINLHL